MIRTNVQALRAALLATALSCVVFVAPAAASYLPVDDVRVVPPGASNATLGGIAASAAGDIYVADRISDRAQSWSAAGVYRSSWGDASVVDPTAVAVDADGNVVVGQGAGPTAQVIRFAPNGAKLGTIPVTDARTVTDVAVGGPAGNIYVLDGAAGRVLVYSPSGGSPTFMGSPIGLVGSTGLDVDSAGNVYVAEPRADRVQRLTLGGGAGTFGSGLRFPYDVAVKEGADAGGDRVIVADYGHFQVRSFTMAGVAMPDETFGSYGSGAGQFAEMTSIAVDGSGTVWVLVQSERRAVGYRPFVNHDPDKPGTPTVAGRSSVYDGEYTVSWAPAKDVDAPGHDSLTYALEHEDGDGEWTAVESGITGTQYDVSEGPGAWRYRVRALDSYGAASGWVESSDAVIVERESAPRMPVAPDAVAVGDHRLGGYRVSWKAAVDENGSDTHDYTLQHRRNGGAWSDVVTRRAGTEYVGAEIDGTWEYQVKATDSTGLESVYSPVSNEIVIDRNRPPSVPQDLVADADGASWSASADDAPGELTYQLQHRDADDPDWSDAADPTTATSVTLDEDEGTWRYRVRAIDAEDEASDWSAQPDPVKIDRTIPNAPTLNVSSAPAYGDWYADSAFVDVTANGDPPLIDGSPGRGVDPATVAGFPVTTNGISTAQATVKDLAGNTSEPGSVAVKVDARGPDVVVADCPVDPVLLGSAQTVLVTATDGESGVDAAADPSGRHALTTSSVGPQVFSRAAADNVGHTARGTCAYDVVWPFAGFYSPVNMDKVNVVKAGSAVPVRFGLGGDRGLDVLADGSPTSQRVNASGLSETDWIEQVIENPGSSPALTYDSTAERYQLVFKTSKDWAGTDRKLFVRLADGTTRTALFRFK